MSTTIPGNNMLRAGVMGWPIAHSLSPRLHGYWLRHYAINGSYEPLPVKPESLSDALHTLSSQGLQGVNLTVPHKEAACAIVDMMDDIAQRIGAINLVVTGEDGKLMGHNTDVYGFTQNLLSAGSKLGGKAVVLGAGGACRAVLVALVDIGFSQILLTNRTLARAEQLAQEFTTPKCAIEVAAWHDAPQQLDDAHLLVNTTSLGMQGQPELIFPLDRLPQQALVHDIVYAPLETGLLRRARARGHPIIDGLGMLLHQARPAFYAFFGRDPEITQELRDFVLAGKKE